MKVLTALLIGLMPSVAFAAPVTFDLRDESIEAIDDVNSFSLTRDGLTATLAALPYSYAGNEFQLNRTASAFGVNVKGTTCGTLEDSATLDGGCIGEVIQVVFDMDVLLNSLVVSLFGPYDQGSVKAGVASFDIGSTGSHSLGNTFLTAGTPWTVAHTAGNGFSFDRFTATAVRVSEPAVVSLLLLGMGAIAAGRRKMSV